jgi:hypothetical protein
MPLSYSAKASIKLTWDDIEVENKLAESVIKYEKIRFTRFKISN